MASSNWARNSLACPLMMPMYLPMARNRVGKSLGPITRSATTASSNSLLEVRSNIATRLPTHCALAPPRREGRGA